ncbi:metallophosphoesterase family protein [Parahaliea aestuarii]|uniref:Metallophosphoesterase n=1 Tax=Parahaliea aestuarii TaxID=1852021 RepID=A0A5C8ZNP0_9GAMM|nr:metallophosphoesterase [Parahaliea aestuarii]TXS90098.1 metallophosphoesterase [Parahaliea aestuarii]
MNTILHISDTHFGTELPRVQRALLEFSVQQSPEVILLSGDITQRARRSQFAAARQFIESLPAPVMAVPGNHDIPLFNLAARMLNPYGNYRRYLGHDLAPAFESDSLLVLGVNSSRAARHTDGEVSSEQVERVARRLRQAGAGQLRIVMQHHPVRAVESSDLENLLIGRERAVPEWVDAGMDLLVAGHIHLPYVQPLQGSGQRQAWTAQAGTAISDRIRGEVPNSVNLIRYSASENAGSAVRACRVERWDYCEDSAGFTPVEQHSMAFPEN